MRFLIDSLIGLTLIGMLLSVLLIHRKQQRLLVDSLIALLSVAVLVSVLLYHRERNRWAQEYKSVHNSLAQLYEQATYRGVLEVRDQPTPGFPRYVSPEWFVADGLPMNATVPGRNPWLDVAPPDDFSDHPPDPVISWEGQAGIWYNPNRGVFRARVMPQWSEAATLHLYNLLNDTELTHLEVSNTHVRQPKPLMTTILVKADRDLSVPTDASEDTPGGQATLINGSGHR